MKKNWTVIIPAAGKSKRFKFHKSKMLFKYNNKYLIEHIIDKVKDKIRNIIIVTNKENIKEIKKIFEKNNKNNIKIILQKKNKGLAIAIQNGLIFTKTKYFCTIWGDQIGLSKSTISKSINLHQKNIYCVTFPIYFKKKPYVDISLKNKIFLDKITQSRETSIVKMKGHTDCGIFCCDTIFIKKKLNAYIKNKKIITKKTLEHDFLLSLNLLAKNHKIRTFKTFNKKDTIGINQLKDLEKI